MSDGLLYTRFFWGDYLRDTMTLSLAEHGAYIKLLAHYYSTGKPIPDDQAVIHRIAGATSPDEQSATVSVLQTFFQYDADSGVFRSKRADREFANAREKAQKRSEAGKRGAQSRWQTDSKTDGKRMANAMANAWQVPSVCHDFANGKTMAYQRPDTRVQSPESKDQKPESKNGFLSQFDDHAESVLSLARETLEAGRFIPITKKQANKYAQFSADVADRSLDDWREYFEMCNRQAWIDGKFKPTYGWLVSPDNVPEVEAGKYAGDGDSVDDTVAKLLQDTDAVVDAEWEVAS